MSADLLEALVGAIFLDCGMDLDVVWKIIYGLMKDRILNIHETLKLSPVTKLYQIRNAVKRT
jgi:endoribonuclease Dicer